jgi:DUF1680 family protein
MERGLYNLIAASTSVDRNAFFYNNPAQRRTAHPTATPGVRQLRAEAPGTRPAWFKCACCPPNIMRTVAALGAYSATYDGTGVQLHQFLPAELDTPFGRLDVSTGYPNDGVIELVVTTTDRPEWTLSLRLPDWCRDPTVSVNGQVYPVQPDQRGYLRIHRQWHTGDVVRYVLPMPLRLTVAHPAVDAVRGMAAIERGPIVYCFESPDQPSSVDLNRVELLPDRGLREDPRHDLPGPAVVAARVTAVARDDAPWERSGWASLSEAPPRRGREVELVAVPYHLWANRGPSVMRIFTPIWSG